MTTERLAAPTSGDEREMLCGWLDYERATLVHKCDGLSAPELARRAAPPSDLSLVGLVRHMARVERNYVRTIFGGEELPEIFGREGTSNAAISDAGDDCADEAFRIWRAECDAARLVIDSASRLDQLSVNERRSGGQVSLRWLLIFMTQEYARHNGHADLIREAIDGTTGS